MNDQTQQALAEAFELIEAEKLDEARAILKPMLTTHRDNPDVWWLYAHAVVDVEEAQTALNQVLRLDPNYPGAGELVSDLERQPASREAVDVVDTEPGFLADIPPTLPDLPEDEDLADIVDLDAQKTIESEEPSRARLLLLAALGLVALAVIVAVAVITSQPRESAPTPTPEGIAAQPSSTPLIALPEATAETTPAETGMTTPEATGMVIETTEAAATADEALGLTLEATEAAATEPTSQPDVTTQTEAVEEPSATPTRPRPTARPTQEPTHTAEPSATATEEAATPTPETIATAANLTGPLAAVTSDPAAEGNPLTVFIQALIPFDLAARGVGIEQTSQGDTVVANICTDPGPDLRSKLPEVMDVIVRQPLTAAVDAIGTRMVNCSDNSPLLLIVVPISDAQAYASGTLSEEDFQARWKSI